MTWYVQIKRYDNNETIKEMGPYSSEWEASKVDSGLNINLNHEEYYTLITEKMKETA